MNHTRLGYGLLSVHQVIFLGVVVKMTPNLAENCWRASRREEQQGRAGQRIHLLKVQINAVHIFTPDFLWILKALNNTDDSNLKTLLFLPSTSPTLYWI